ncbi:MAG TPA: nodulation protein NfeD [bacterium]|nr:nodulation protein NfeD [bacterium]HQJ64728.1 nodulation protein NfeD [bacterium]
MRYLRSILIPTALLLAAAPAPAAAVEEAPVLKIVINGDINPVSAMFIVQSIHAAEKLGCTCLIVQMDTPGGLLESTKTIVKEILAAKVPVVMYVAPSGSGAVSAGVFITLACHVVAMAEGTNIGAAHPVSAGGGADTTRVMNEKVTNYASAWIRSLAEKRGRNPEWAEQAVRKSVSITEKEALEKKIIDLIARDETALLEALDGRTVQLDDGNRVLKTRNAPVITREMSWQHRILYKISNPTIAYILLMLGIYGLFFELSNPGAIVPGVAGGIFIILAFFALQTLPVNTAGLLLILFSILLFVLEVKVTSYGVLTIGGIISMFLGAIMLFDETPGFSVRVDWRVALTFALVTAAFFIFALGMALKARLTRPTTGQEGLIGARGIALDPISPHEGTVKILGEIWKAQSAQHIAAGTPVEVLKVEGLVLTVAPSPDQTVV